MNYDVNYFIKKFEAIPESLWCTRRFTDVKNNHCAMGHCGQDAHNETYEGECLWNLVYDFHLEGVEMINDGDCSRYQQPTPKQRVLAALYDIKKMQEPQVKELPAPKMTFTKLEEMAEKTELLFQN